MRGKRANIRHAHACYRWRLNRHARVVLVSELKENLEDLTHRNLDEVARTVGADEQHLVHGDRPPQHGTADDNSYPPHLVNTVDREVNCRQLRCWDLQEKKKRGERGSKRSVPCKVKSRSQKKYAQEYRVETWGEA